MRITEIFYSIQGESSYAGKPCAFVRLTYCNLRCSWCDTEYAFTGGTEMSLSEVLAAVKSYACRLVEITGGEPLLQKEVYPLTETLLAEGYVVLIDTGGSLDVSGLDPRVIKILDIKCPGSGMAEENLWSNLEHLTPRDEIKFVIADRRDFDWAASVIRERDLAGRFQILFSPVHGKLDPKELADWILKENLPVRLQIQLHKYLWGPDARGV